MKAEKEWKKGRMVVRLCKASKLNNTRCVMEIQICHYFIFGVQKIYKSQKNYSNSKKLQTSFEKPRSVTQYPTTKKCAQMFSFVSRKNEKIQRNFSLRSINVQMMSYADENKNSQHFVI